MQRPIVEYTFKQVDGKWVDIKGEGFLLADVLESYGIIVDERTEFLRLRDYSRMISFWYRDMGGKVTLTLWRMHL